MKRMKKISRSAISLVLAFSILFSGTSIAPITVSTARAIEAGTILEHGFGLLGTVAEAIGPALFGKILNSTGNSELADYLGLNKANEVTLEELKESIDDIQDQLGTISEQVTTLSNELASEADRLESWTTLTTFQQSYGGLSSNNDDYLQTMLQLDNGDYSESSYQKQLGQLMETIYRDDAFRQDVIAMGDAIMGEGSSLVSPTRAYYDHRKQVDGTTRDQLIADYLAFSTSVYKDYVISLLLCNASMTYLAEQEGGNVLYEIQMNNMAQQAQRVKAFLYNEREALFPADRLDGVSGGAVPSTAQSANDYVITYENGQPVRTQTKQGASANDLLLSEYYLMLNVGEATAVKVFKSGQQFSDWTTSDPSVAVVDELGGVFATGAGTAILTVNYGGYTKRVQVDVLDVDSNGLPITTTTGEVRTVTTNASFDLDKLLDEAGIEEADAADFTWTSTDTNSVAVSGTTIKGVAKSGGYSMVTGMRHVRYDTDGGSFYTVEKVIFPFKAEYTDTSEVYDYDDMIYENCFEKSGRITLATDLTAASPYGQICQKTKLRFDLVSNDGLIVDGKGHCMDLMGARLMQEMNAQSSVSNISLYSSCNMDDAAVVNELPATAVIKDVDINVNIVGNRQYLGGAVNEASGRIDGVTFYGSITNSYTSDAKDITSSVNGSATLPQEGIRALYGDNDQEHAIMYQTGTGGIVGRQDVNAEMNDGEWTRTDTTTGIYNCYSSGDITAGTNTGGIAGLVVGAWSNVENNGNTAFDPVDLQNVSEEDPANAAYVPVYASVSDSDVSASAKDGIAGGLIGFSVFADIKGGSVTGSVTGGSDASGRASGVSGIYLPTIWRSILNLALQIYFAQGSGCLIDGVLVGANISSGNGRVSPYYYDDMSVNFPEHTGGPFSGTYQEFIDNEFQKHDLYQSKDEIDEVNSNVSNTIDAVLQTNSNAGINNGWPIFSTTHTGVAGSFDMENVYEYGDGLTPVTSDNVIRIEYAAQGSTQFSEAVPTDVGNYTARATFTDETMVNDNFRITPRIVTLVDPAETTLEFEDRELTAKSPYISNAVPGDDVAVTVEVGSNKGSEVGEYTLKVTGLTGVDAANYELPESGYTMPWSITISDQKPAKIVLTLNEQPCDSYTLYYNDEARNTLDLRSITTMVTDEDGYEYRGDDTVTWPYKGDGAALIDGVLKASKQGKGTLIASIGDVSAEIAITIAERSTINMISQAEGAELVRVDTAYDLTTILLHATDLGGHPYTLSKDELNAISWEVWQEQSKGITATIDGTTLKVTALEGREGILVLRGVLNDVSWNAELVVRQQSVPTELKVTTLQSESVISLTPNTTREIANYLSCICLDQYGDEMDAEIIWKSDNTDVLTISDNEAFVASKIEGTANVTASIGTLESEPVTIQVAGAPRLTSIKITGAPQALGWNEMLDLRTLIVSKYDQRGNEMTGEASKIYWSLENDENTDAEVLNDLVPDLRTGDSN